MEARPGPSTRRPPAHRSVSLRHTHTKGAPTTTSTDHRGSTLAESPSSVSPPLAPKQSSGESSDVGQWFDNTNRNAEQTNANDQFVDTADEPPFLLRNTSSSNSPAEGEPYTHRALSIPHRPGILRMPTEGSTSEDYRGVIDDLTVANKKLKQKLKKYERLYDAHLQNERLFEVRFHGLSDDKKKELEETLRKFAVGLDTTPEGGHSPIPLKTEQTKFSEAAESGYGTMSGSGQNSIGFSLTHGNRGKESKSDYIHQQQSIQTYLHDIPAGLLPRPNACMSDSTKKKLVVRRLEQLFAGKLSTPGSHQQPLQQEEVAQSAAMADRIVKEARGGRTTEGDREALIMPLSSSEEGRSTPHATAHSTAQDASAHQQDIHGNVSPDQRPTRPMDLDPARAQVPHENMEYIRHLGFQVPPSGEEPQDGHGWVYLNLLINMAQLHTVNVTPEFVKDALTEYSSKIELSHDGRKIRWRGGHDVTLNSDSSSDPPGSNSPYGAFGESSSRSAPKRQKSEYKGDNSESPDLDTVARRARSLKQNERQKFAYTPLFYHRQESEEDDDIFNGLSSSSNSPPFAQQRGNSSAFASTRLRSDSSKKKRDNGPMIFYNKANFCTDLSGDREGRSPGAVPTSYETIAPHPLGATSDSRPSPYAQTRITETKGPLDAVEMDLDPKEPDYLATSSEDNFVLSFPDLSSESSGNSPLSVDFEASGIGGVMPDDNFAIRVRRQQSRAQTSTGPSNASKIRFYPKKILDLLNENQQEHRPVVEEQILSTLRRNLPSSELPPASYLRFDSTSSGDVDSDLESDSDVSSNPLISSSADDGPPITPQVHHIAPIHREESSGEASEDSDNSGYFASAYRKRSRASVIGSVSDSHGTERFGIIPAGSSAATAGGGSGFNTPADFPSGETAMSNAHKRPGVSSPGNLKRARTSDSIAATLQEPAKSQRLN